jgi:L-rhamnose isomerase/sugar isomerase
MNNRTADRVVHALDAFHIELPSWGFADTGTRFGVFRQAAAAGTIEEKFADAAVVHALTGACPALALHVEWDLPGGLEDTPRIAEIARTSGLRPGAINPNFFQQQRYKHGSFGNAEPDVRQAALDHGLESIDIARRLASRDVSCWFADGSNYPGTANIRERKRWFGELLAALHARLGPGQRLLIEYKPFEPAFYHTDIADWGMALLLAREAGPRARVLVDTGHHYPGQNIEQIVAWLLAEGMLGGFHFNDRRYADDDLTLGSIDPYQVFRIFHEIGFFAWETGAAPDLAYMIDQCHNLKGKIEAMVQTVGRAQALVAKAALVDYERLAAAQRRADLVQAEECLQDAFATDVRPLLKEWRRARQMAEDPLEALRESGHVERIARERQARREPAPEMPTLGASEYTPAPRRR